jgi:hypothetical protein
LQPDFARPVPGPGDGYGDGYGDEPAATATIANTCGRSPNTDYRLQYTPTALTPSILTALARCSRRRFSSMYAAAFRSPDKSSSSAADFPGAASFTTLVDAGGNGGPGGGGRLPGMGGSGGNDDGPVGATGLLASVTRVSSNAANAANLLPCSFFAFGGGSCFRIGALASGSADGVLVG